MSHWYQRFMSMAQLVSTWSRDPSTKVGAVIVRPDHTIASLGFNGFPRGTRDDADLYNHRPTKLLRTVHAEANAILAAHGSVKGCDIFVTPLHPCANCAGLIIQAGIRSVHYRMPKQPSAEWAVHFHEAMAMFEEAGVGVHEYRGD